MLCLFEMLRTNNNNHSFCSNSNNTSRISNLEIAIAIATAANPIESPTTAKRQIYRNTQITHTRTQQAHVLTVLTCAPMCWATLLLSPICSCGCCSCWLCCKSVHQLFIFNLLFSIRLLAWQTRRVPDLYE